MKEKLRASIESFGHAFIRVSQVNHHARITLPIAIASQEAWKTSD